MRLLHLSLMALLLAAFAHSNTVAQTFTKDDSLRGSITPERAWWDLTYYDLKVQVKPESKSISGSVDVHYKVLTTNKVMQIDLQPPLKISEITQDGEKLSFSLAGKNAYRVILKKDQQPGRDEKLTVVYAGKPVEAKLPPWDGGFQWTYDKNGNAFIATSCQGIGASVWWPCKDHMYDEPDSMRIRVTCPKDLMDVSNGRLRKTTTNADGTRTFDWFVSNPINNYGVNVNIGNYVHWSDTLNGEQGVLDIDYYAIDYNVDKAKEQFKQVKLMLRAFEHWFGPYPFYKDGYKIVEVPYLGMEHQSSITYGNQYQNGYLGRDLSGTGWGLKWDFIIIHESGHEWFANNITYKDIADMWIHEGFTNYSETLYTEYHFGVEAGNDYNYGTRIGIANDIPIIGEYNVNERGSGDMYPKGGNLLHTIRHSMNNDKLFREILRGLNKTFYHQTVTTQQIENYISEKSGYNYGSVFDQYLRTIIIPQLEFKVENGELSCRWTRVVDGFNLPIVLQNKSTQVRIVPTAQWQTLKLHADQKALLTKAGIERMYYVNVIGL